MYLIKVLIEYQNINLDKTFDYLSSDAINIFSRVLVPFANRKVVGFVIDVVENGESEFELKEVIKVIDTNPLINDELYQLTNFMQQKYISSRIQALQTILPTGLKPSSNQKQSVIYDLYLEIVDSNVELTIAQCSAYDKIKEMSLLKHSEVTKTISAHMINELLKKGYLKKVKKIRNQVLVNQENNDFIKLNDSQLRIYHEIITSNDSMFLLHGVTGSGKTQIYLHLAQYYLNQDKTVLVLVPEITLTLMMQEQFASHFENNIAILHSKLSNSQKYQEYQKIIEKKVNIVVGTRSSVFAPLENIGIIIIDEEHDNSYKQSSGLMYHTNDIAEFRTEYNNAKLVLGSATPSVNSMTKAYQKIYKYLLLNHRFLNQKLPDVEVVDLNYESINNVVSNKVLDTINKYLLIDKQVIVLLNRRGYNTMFQCRDCQATLMCPNCNVALTYHNKNKSLVCHHCGYSTKNISQCFYCQSTNLKKLGYGTERVEEYLVKELNKYKIIRIDQDTIKKISDLEKKIKAFNNKEANVLIGTQMIAKGLDFESADLVVVLNIDASIAFNSYDALESAFTLLVQVSGRSGRHSGEGKVLVESYQPQHYIIQRAQKHDYLGFYEIEMRNRLKYENPPYYKIALLMVSGEDENKVIKEATSIYEYLNTTLTNCLVYNNMDHPIYRLANVYRQQIVIKYKKLEYVSEEILRLKKIYGSKSKINLVVDIDY